MAEPEAQRAMTLEEFASISAALEAGLPRDEILAEAGFTKAAWESAQERWLATLADQAALGRLADGRRYVELLGAKKPAAAARAKRTRKKLPGKAPIAPAPPIAPRLTTASEKLGPTNLSPAREGASTAADQRISKPLERPEAPRAHGTWSRPDDETTGVVQIAKLHAATEALPFVQAGAGDDHEPITPRRTRPDSALPFSAPKPPPADDEEALPFATTAAIRRDAEPPPSALPFTAPPAALAASGLPFTASPPPPGPNPLPFRAPEAPSALPFAAKAPPNTGGLPFGRPRTQTLVPSEVADASRPAPPAASALPFNTTAPPVAPAPPRALPFQAAPPAAPSALPFQAPVPAAPPAKAPSPSNAGPPPTPTVLPFATSGAPQNPLPFTPSPALESRFSATRPAPATPPANNPLPFQAPSPAAKSALPFTPPAAPAASAPAPATGSFSFAMPFQRPAEHTPSAPPPPLGPATPAPAAPAPRAQTPYQPPHPDRFTLADYAHLCAGVRVHPTHVPWIRSLYGLSEQGWTALHARWQQHFAQNPELRAEWNRLIQERMPAWRR